MKSASLIVLTAALSTFSVANAAWQKVPAVKSAPVNVSSASIVGAKVVSSSGISNTQSLLSDDPAQFAKLPAGASFAVIDLSDQTTVNFASFINEGATGVVSVSASTNNSDWVALSKQPLDSATRLVELKFAGAQAKYVRISFELSNAGSITSLKLLGSSKISDYLPQAVKSKGKGASKNDVSVGIDGTKPVYIYPTPAFFGELENGQASYKFPKTSEKYRTIIYDLGDVETLGKFSAAYSKVPTRVEVFVFEQLPEKQDWRGKTTFDPATLDAMQPLAVAEDAKGLGYINIKTKPVVAKYVVMRFEPNYSKGVASLSFDLPSVAAAALTPFPGVANQLGILNLPSFWRPVAAEGSGEFVVLNTKMTSDSKNFKVYISKSAIAKMQAQMGPGTTELAAINAILAAAGFESVTGAQPGEGGSNANTDGTPANDVADPALSNALSGFGLSAYRNGGAGGIGGGGGSSNSNSNNNNSSNNGSNGPIVIITETVNPTTP